MITIVPQIIGYTLASVAGGYVTINLGNAIADVIHEFCVGLKESPATRKVRKAEQAPEPQKTQTAPTGVSLGFDLTKASDDTRSKLMSMVQKNAPIGDLINFCKQNNIRYFK